VHQSQKKIASASLLNSLWWRVF